MKNKEKIFTISGSMNSNGIAVRGNSPLFMQWRIEGVEAVNPTHFSDITAVGGGIAPKNICSKKIFFSFFLLFIKKVLLLRFQIANDFFLVGKRGGTDVLKKHFD